MRTPEDLKNGYRAFRRGVYKHHANLYEELGRGQDPDIMIIACADSRAEPADIFNAAPGQLFVVRNVANLVPPYETGGGQHGVSAALEFAVTALEVEHIVIMGHGGCGGVQASLSAADVTAALRIKPKRRSMLPRPQLLGRKLMRRQSRSAQPRRAAPPSSPN